jgi:hypothetical protein
LKTEKDACPFSGALLEVYQGGMGRRILMENRDKQDGSVLGVSWKICAKLPRTAMIILFQRYYDLNIFNQFTLHMFNFPKMECKM